MARDLLMTLGAAATAAIGISVPPAIAGITSKNLGAVWFVGDSITQGNADNDSNGSPRRSLYDKLTAAGGYTFTDTGHSTSNLDGLPNIDNFKYH